VKYFTLAERVSLEEPAPLSTWAGLSAGPALTGRSRFHAGRNEKAPPLSGGASLGNLRQITGATGAHGPKLASETLTKSFDKRARVKTGFRGPQSPPDKTILPNEDRQSSASANGLNPHAGEGKRT
jgi:hypothetical protein